MIITSKSSNGILLNALIVCIIISMPKPYAINALPNSAITDIICEYTYRKVQPAHRIMLINPHNRVVARTTGS